MERILTEADLVRLEKGNRLHIGTTTITRDPAISALIAGQRALQAELAEARGQRDEAISALKQERGGALWQSE